jgi:hypothetical protein
MLTPKEIIAAPAMGEEEQPSGYDAELNPFGEFSSITRDIGDW